MPSLKLYWRYLLELRSHALAFTGGLLFLSGGMILDAWGPDWWTSPPAILYIALAVVGLIVTQLNAGVALLRQKENPPTIKGHLRLEYERPREDGLSARLKFPLGASKGQELHMLCDAPLQGGYVSSRELEHLKITGPRRAFLVLESDLGSGAALDLHVLGFSGVVTLQEIELVGVGKKPTI